jgi:hypothetical protein
MLTGAAKLDINLSQLVSQLGASLFFAAVRQTSVISLSGEPNTTVNGRPDILRFLRVGMVSRRQIGIRG